MASDAERLRAKLVDAGLEGSADALLERAAPAVRLSPHYGPATDPSRSWAPRGVPGVGPDVIMVASGWAHSLAVGADGSVWAWGYNARGQLGDGTKVERTDAVAVRGLADAVAVAAGQEHSLALRRDGTVVAWGANDRGQMRDGTRKHRLRPVRVPGLPAEVSVIAAGHTNSFALLRDGSGVGWGGVLGTNVEGLGAIVAVASGDYHFLALRQNGVVLAWGDNGVGALGDGTTTTSTTRYSPEPVLGLVGSVVAIAAGADHSFALMADGSVMAWGANTFGQLGNGQRASAVPVPVTVALEAEAIAVAAGRMCSFALMRDGRVMSWGQNVDGVRGDAGETNRLRPGLVSGLGPAVRAIAPRVALMADGSVRRWGGERPEDDAGADAQIRVGASKLGGTPDLPAGTAWPTDAARPMAFVGQIDFAAVAGLADDHGLLPPAGLLSLFVASDDIGPSLRFHVHFTEPTAVLVRAPLPAELADGDRFEAVALHPERELSWLPPQSLAREGLGLSDPDARAYEALVDPGEAPAHRLLGHPTLPADVDGCGADDGLCLLWQVDSDFDTGLVWGDLGRLHLWIGRDDLQARRFDRATLEFQQ